MILLKSLSPEGSLRKQTPRGPFDFTYVLSPVGTLRVADTEGGPIVFTYVLFCLRKRILDFQFTGGFLPFLNLQNVLL